MRRFQCGSGGLLVILACAAAAGPVTHVAATNDGADAHAAHRTAGPEASVADAPPGVSRSSMAYSLPTLKLVRDDGRRVELADELNDGRPVVLNFIYTTCSGICPLASHVFAQLQHELGTQRDHVHLVSISIDPEEDTPARLRAYARQYSAGPSWQHYTGTVEASIAVQRAFNVYRGDKMGHTPVTFVRTAPGEAWVRLDGFATADLLLRELHGQTQVTAAAAPNGR
jgi:protein SCO1